MNKQELIEELECIEVSTDSLDYLKGADYANERAINLAKQLGEPKKVVVPQVVADWIKYAKQQGYGFMQSYDPKKMFYPINDGLDKWINDNEETFAHAWLDGYEVMKEPLYYVKLPEIGYMRFGFCIPITESIEEAKKYTEQEIKAVDERYWPFAVKVDGE
ncbi:DUF1642 domain-containing protein [Enterococcus faecalis]|uniref:DUF1642 domain-containing protein n=1 Tax=Enterococcus faecalis TaxID=1351 RepID=UPI00032EC92F|nr:DUF1642 domain-containing protein [Enterococcus faecalis]EOF51908.1 hypothetical protein SCS_01290 [Enterococcus faecalis EnGen0117]